MTGWLQILNIVNSKAPTDLLTKSMSEVVDYLKQPCKTDMETTRVLFAWFCSQDTTKMPPACDTGDGEKANVITVKEILSGHKTEEI